MKMRVVRWLVASVSLAACTVPTTGCGSSEGRASQAELDAAREQGARDAAQSEKVKALEKELDEVRRSKSEKPSTKPVVVSSGESSRPATPRAASGGGGRTFHAPSGNVSCRVTSSTAACTVASIGTTFVLPASGPAYTESSAQLARGAGEAAGYGQTISVGGVTCEVPPSSVARGISCTNSDGHGFEASRVSSRQKTY